MPLKYMKRHLLPHPQHKKRATLLRNQAILLYSAGVLMVFSFLKTMPTVAPGILGYASNINVTDLLRYTNAKRATVGVASLTLNSSLSQAAQKKAQHMFQYNYWAHVAPDGTDPWSFIISEDYDYLYAGENLAKNFSNSKDVVEAWYKSPSHQENLIGDKYSDVGFAVINGVLDGYETTLVVQMFGKPRNTPAVAIRGVDNTSASQPVQEVTPTEILVPTRQTIASPTLKIDVYSTTKTFALAFASFMLLLFALDVWYSRKHGILKFTGHSLAHMAFLVFAVVVIYFSLQPGRLI